MLDSALQETNPSKNCKIDPFFNSPPLFSALPWSLAAGWLSEIQSLVVYLYSKKQTIRYFQFSPTFALRNKKARVCYRPCNPNKWEADIWGWFEVRRSAVLHYKVNQSLHWTGQQYDQPGMARCWEMSTLPAGNIPQHKETSASCGGFHCVCEVL